MDNNSTIQRFISNYKEGFASYQYKPKKSYVIRSVNLTDKQASEDLYVNMASCSKPFLIRAFIEILCDKYVSISDFKFSVDQKYIQEMISRGSITRVASHQNYDDYRKRILEKGISLENIEDTVGDLDIEFTLPFDEICFGALTLSSNRAVESILSFIKKEFGETSAFQEALLNKKFYVDIEFHQGGNLYWEQPGANTAKLSSIIMYFKDLVGEIEQSNTSDLKSTMISIMGKYMKNNLRYFDTSASMFVKSFSTNRIYEKTGVMFPVCWGEKIYTQVFPPHLILCNIFSIVQDGKDPHNYFNYLAVAIDLPKELDREGFPDISQRGYMSYINVIKLKHFFGFQRNNLKILKQNNIPVNWPKVSKIFISNYLKLVLHRIKLRLITSK